MTTFQVVVCEMKEYIPNRHSKAPAFLIACPAVGFTLNQLLNVLSVTRDIFFHGINKC